VKIRKECSNLRIVLFIFLLFFVSCYKKEAITQQTLDIGNIHLKYPSDWKLTEQQGIDSYFSYLSKNDDTIWIQYGMYNHKIYQNPLNNHLFKQITIDGREAVIETSKNSYGGSACIYIPKTDSMNGFLMFNKKGSIEEVLAIYKTIRIGNHKIKQRLDTNPENFRNKNLPPGIVVYENNCLSCHSERQFIIGPALDRDFIRSKSKNWMKKYICSKKNPLENIECSQINDSIQIKEIMKYMYQK
jgi:hypothetical protein